MSVKLDTYITKENKISKKQYPITVTDEINIGLLHQVVTSIEQTIETTQHQ